MFGVWGLVFGVWGLGFGAWGFRVGCCEEQNNFKTEQEHIGAVAILGKYESLASTRALMKGWVLGKVY